MTIAYPRTFPHHGFVQGVMTIRRRQATGMSEGGDDFVIDRGAASWAASWKTRPLDHQAFGEWRAWLASLQGLAKPFLGYDPARWVPLAYMTGDAHRYPIGFPPAMVRADGSSFDGTAAVSGIDSLRVAPELSGLPAGFVFTAGDYVSFIQDGRYSLHTVLEPIVAGSGVATLSVEPRLPDFLTTSAVANLYRPCAKFTIASQVPDMTADGAGRNRPGDVTFAGLSTLR